MATADTEGHLSGRNCGDKLFSKQYCEQLIQKVVKIPVVVQKFKDCRTLSEAERESLRSKKLADDSFRNILTIISIHANGKDLQPLEKFIDILRDTNNNGIAEQLLAIYKERVSHAATLSQLSEDQALIKSLQNEIIDLKKKLKEKDRYIEILTDEKNKLVDHYCKVADTQREKKLSLEKKIKKKEEELVFAKKENEKLTRTKNELENEVKVKTNDIHKREEEIVEKEREVRESIEESDRLRLEIELLQQQHSKAMVENKEELSKEIEILQVKLVKKENTIQDLRQKKTMTGKEIDEKLGNIMKSQEENLIDQMAMIKQQNEKIDDQAAMAKQQNEKIDDQMAMLKQQSEQMNAIMRALSLQENK